MKSQVMKPFLCLIKVGELQFYSCVHLQMPRIFATTWEVMAKRLKVLSITERVIDGQSFFSVKRVSNEIQ